MTQVSFLPHIYSYESNSIFSDPTKEKNFLNQIQEKATSPVLRRFLATQLENSSACLLKCPLRCDYQEKMCKRTKDVTFTHFLNLCNIPYK